MRARIEYRLRSVWWAALVLVGCEPKRDVVPPPASLASACTTITFEGDSFTHCLAEPGKHRIRLALDGPDGKPWRDLGRMAEGIGEDARHVAFAMNGGMFDEAGEPIGYYVQAGERVRKLNRKPGAGNFHLLPNGVFSVEADGWHVRTTDEFAALPELRPDYATQSGPMLVIAGKLHPKFSQNGDSLYIRNAVGIDRQGRAHFVISDKPVSFGRIARLFRDSLACPNALYLDGAVSALWDPGAGRIDRTVPLGPLIVVEKAPKTAP